MTPSTGSGQRFVRACAVADVSANSALAVEIGRDEIAIVNSGGQFYAIADECSHAAIPLSEGDVEDGEIECYLHGSRFDLRTGQPLGLPATEAVAVYPCQISGDDVLVDVSAPINIDAGGTTPPNPPGQTSDQNALES